MRAWTMIIALVLSALFGGQSLGASSHGCERGSQMPAAHASHAASHAMAQLGDSMSLQDHCCADTGTCQMTNCMAQADLPMPPAIMPGEGIDMYLSEAPPVLTGLAPPPLHGPPRLFLS